MWCSLVGGAIRHSPTVDEVGHLAAALSHWRLGRFDLYSVNPPLVRLVAGLPIAHVPIAFDWHGYIPNVEVRSEFTIGLKALEVYGPQLLPYFTLARFACIPFSILGAVVCLRWSTELYGPVSGLIALSLWCFSPNIIAHGQQIIPDVGASAFAVASAYLLWRWLKVPKWLNAINAGIALGLALLCKNAEVVTDFAEANWVGCVIYQILKCVADVLDSELLLGWRACAQRK